MGTFLFPGVGTIIGLVLGAILAIPADYFIRKHYDKKFEKNLVEKPMKKACKLFGTSTELVNSKDKAYFEKKRRGLLRVHHPDIEPNCSDEEK